MIRSVTLSYSLTVPINTRIEQAIFSEKRMPMDGVVVQVVLFFPAGTQGTTGVWFSIEGETVFPYEEGTSIALDNVTLPFIADIAVRRGDRLRLYGFNSDNVNAHTIRAVVTMAVSL